MQTQNFVLHNQQDVSKLLTLFATTALQTSTTRTERYFFLPHSHVLVERTRCKIVQPILLLQNGEKSKHDATINNYLSLWKNSSMTWQNICKLQHPNVQCAIRKLYLYKSETCAIYLQNVQLKPLKPECIVIGTVRIGSTLSTQDEAALQQVQSCICANEMDGIDNKQTCGNDNVQLLHIGNRTR